MLEVCKNKSKTAAKDLPKSKKKAYKSFKISRIEDMARLADEGSGQGRGFLD